MIVVLAALVIMGIISPYMKIVSGEPIDITIHTNPHIWEKVPPVTPYTAAWSTFDIAGAILCFFLGFVCFVLWVIRALNKLESKQILLISLFSILFSLNTLSMTSNALRFFKPETLFYMCWITFFIYPIPLFIYFYNNLRTSFKRWLWLVILLLAVYAAVAWVMFTAFGLPFDISDKLYTPMGVVAVLLNLIAGLFGA